MRAGGSWDPTRLAVATTSHLQAPTRPAIDSSLTALRLCLDHCNYNTVVKMFDCPILLAVGMQNLKTNVFRNYKKHFLKVTTAG